ncbi:MAG: hypothetical protein AAGJ28_26680 [Pseudomonadota bacterium]
MPIFDRWFRGKAKSSPVELTPQAAAEIRKIARQGALRFEEISVVVGGDPAGTFSLDLSEDARHLHDPGNLVTESQGLRVVVSKWIVRDFPGLVIDSRMGGFLFQGPHVPQAVASHPGKIDVSEPRLFRLMPSLEFDEDTFVQVRYHLHVGDSRAALVASLEPLIVAAYSSDFDAVVPLEFPSRLIREFGLALGTRLVTVNTYLRGNELASDILRGDRATDDWHNCVPLIADFITDDSARLAELKSGIDEEEWQRAYRMAIAALKRANGRYRSGLPTQTEAPA